MPLFNIDFNNLTTDDHEKIGKIALFTTLVILLCIFVAYVVLLSYVYSNDEQPTFNSILENNDNSVMKRMDYSAWSLINGSSYMDSPLGSFYISTSDNSAFEKYKFITTPSVTNILNTLNLGARCIHLNVFSKDNIPVIKYGTGLFTKKSIYLENTLELIKCYSSNKTSDPIIIYLNIVDYKKTKFLENINTIIKNSLSNHQYEGTFDLVKDSKDYLPNVAIKKLLNKIAIIAAFNGSNKTSDDIKRFIYPVINAVCVEQDGGWFKDSLYTIDMVSNDTKKINKPLANVLTKVNSSGIGNYDPYPFFNMNYSMIGLNYITKDYLHENSEIFSLISYIPKNTFFNGSMFTPVENIKDTKYTEDFYDDLYSVDQASVNIIKEGQSFKKCYWVNGDYTMKFINGNLSIYKGTKLKWSTNTDEYDDAILMFTDGNLEIHYKKTASDPVRIVWDSKLKSNSYGYAKLGSNGKLQIYNKYGKLLY